MNTPQVSVIMLTYNSQRYLPAALDSMVRQTYPHFELLAVDGGSQDQTIPVIETYAARDPRIRLLSNGRMDICTSRNYGVNQAQGKYIAWLDSDDVAYPRRLEEQVRHLEENTQIGISGGAMRLIGRFPPTIHHFPLDDASIRCLMLFSSPFANSTVLMRRSLFDTLQFRISTSEDYDLWCQAAEITQFANSPRVLVDYRLHPGQDSHTGPQTNPIARRAIFTAQLQKLGINPAPFELDIHQMYSGLISLYRVENLDAYAQWLFRLLAANRQQGVYPQSEFDRVVGRCWYAVCSLHSRLGRSAWRACWQWPLARLYPFSISDRLKLAIKCLAKSR